MERERRGTSLAELVLEGQARLVLAARVSTGGNLKGIGNKLVLVPPGQEEMIQVDDWCMEDIDEVVIKAYRKDMVLGTTPKGH